MTHPAILAILLVTVLCPIAIVSGEQQAAASDNSKLVEGLPNELAMIIDGALGVPPELGAEALIRAATLGGIRSEAKRIALLERALALAAYVKDSHPQVFVGPRHPTSKEYFEGIRFGLGLDRLSIIARSLTEIGRIDRRHSLEILRQLDPYHLERRSCEDPFVDDVAAYYRLCGVAVNYAFSHDQRSRREDIDLALGALNRVSFAVEVAPAATMLATLQLPPDEIGQLATALAGVLDRVSDSDRSFSAVLPRTDVAIRQALIPRLTKLGIDPRAMQTAYRDYLKRHLSRPRCPDNADPKAPAAAIIPKLTEYFEGIPGIKLDLDINPANEPQRAMRLVPLLSNESEVRTLASRLVIRDSETKTRYRPEERSSEEWRARFEQFLKAVQGLRPGPGQSPEDLLPIKQMLLGEVSALVPSGPERETMIKTYVATLGAAPVDRGIAHWLVHVTSFLDTVTASDSGNLQNVLAAMEQSGNHNLAFYARMERALPRRKDR